MDLPIDTAPLGAAPEGVAPTPLNPSEAAEWIQVQRTLEGFAIALQEGAPEAVIDATLADLRALPFDHTRVLNALHLPDNAGDYAEGLEKILRRIPDGWGRWISTGPGWYPLLVQLDETLAAIDPAYEVQQVKEKYARLCYYYSASPTDYLQDRAITAAVTAAEQQAAHTCESCGAQGQFMATGNGSGSWYQTLCSACAAASKHGYAPPPPSERTPEDYQVREAFFSTLPRVTVCSLALTLAAETLPLYEQAYPHSFPPASELLALARSYDLTAIGLPPPEVVQAAHLANTLAWSIDHLRTYHAHADWHIHSLARNAIQCLAQAIESVASPVAAWTMALAAVSSARNIALDLVQYDQEEGLDLDQSLLVARAARHAFNAKIDALTASLSTAGSPEP